MTALERLRTGWENLGKDLVIEMREIMTALIILNGEMFGWGCCDWQATFTRRTASGTVDY